ncbi:MAG: phosphate/phosphite/phosphonate ABC transporter substrate-binding protein [Planctomycetota bacterium]
MSRVRTSLLALLLGAFVAACGSKEEGVAVSLRPDSTSAAKAPSPEGPLRIGIGAMLSPSATLDLYGRLVDALGEELHRPAVMVQRATYAEMNDLLKAGRVDAALVCTGAYLQGKRDFGLEALVVPSFDGSPTYRSVILVRTDSGIDRLEDLEGKRFAFVDPLSNTGRMYAVRRLLELGRTPDDFFTWTYTHAHDKSIRAVKERLVDGAAVDELVYTFLRAREPAATEGLKVLERSEAFGAPPVVVVPTVTPALRAKLRQAFLGLTGSKTGRAILAGLSIERFVEPTKGLYESARRQIEFLRQHGEAPSR